MQERHLLRALPVLVVLALIGIGGCGGEGTTTTAAGPSVTLPASDSIAPTQPVTSSTDGSGLVDGLPRGFVQDLGTRPIIVLFYVPGGVDDEVVLKNVTELRNTFRSYTFLLYDYSMPEVYGDLAKDLGVSYQPGLVLIDRHGTAQQAWTGYIDKATLNQLLVNLGRE